MKGSRPGFDDLKKLQQAAARAREQVRRDAVEAVARQQAAPIQAKDLQLFRRAVQTVTPLQATPVVGSKVAPPASIAAPSPEQLAKRRSAMGEPQTASAAPLSDQFSPCLPTDGETVWFAADMAANTPRRLQRGQWPVQARIDLHGMRTDGAREALFAFLADCLAHRVRCVRVIHGKGYGSVGAGPVLRKKTPAWLMQHVGVCAFVQAPPAEGGAGALLVLLRPIPQ